MSRFLIPFAICLTLSACGGGGSSSEPTSPVTPTPPTDTTAPVITLTGSASIQHEQGTAFVDPGATATDNIDGSISVQVSGTVGEQAGTYTLTYSATDAAGNSASAERQVVVSDTTAPVITLVGGSQITLDKGASYSEQGASAQDLVDGEVPVTISGNVNTQVVANYTLTYLATDAAGNSASENRNVIVQEQTVTEGVSVLDNGQASSQWAGGLNAFDEAIGYSECSNDGGAACPSISWRTANDAERGNVLEIEHSTSGSFAGFFVKALTPIDLSNYADGALLFDLKTLAGDGRYTMKLDCVFPCTSGDQQLTFAVDENWTNITIPLNALVQAGLDITKVDTGIVIWSTQHTGNVFQIDNVRFERTFTGESSIAEPGQQPPITIDYTITHYGAGSISDTINPASYKCVFDYGNWIYNAGVVAPGIADCITATGTPIGEPSPLFPQRTGEAETQPVAAHRWWGSVSFMGEMTIGDPNSAAFITPDPITARISNTGFRMMGIPNGLGVYGNDFGYRIPDPFAEVFDGIAIANTANTNLQAYTESFSDGTVTVEWQSQGSAVMTATFVHGSPYVYVDVLSGDLLLKTLRTDGGEKGIFYQGDQSLGVWTSVAGNTNYYLVTGNAGTQFTNPSSNAITVENAQKSYTITLMPSDNGVPNTDMISAFESYALNKVDQVLIDYQVDAQTQAVDITHRYLNAAGEAVTTLVGMHPLHWKFATSNINESGYQVRSARGIIKYGEQSSFTYSIPHVGVLPSLPTFTEQLDVAALTTLIDEFLSVPTDQWNTYSDTYWSGKIYGKVSELIAIADGLDLQDRKATLLNWLKAELEDWFTAENDQILNTGKYFVYDETWSTLLGMDESFAAHQQLNDHHFHYGYFVRAAAEICRHEASWCSEENFGPMVNLLIRDYAGDRDDSMFPYLRHFDPANGFSWASGNVNFVRGNNNESTSEAANAYGAMILFGLVTGDQALVERGTYLHASTAAAFWQYWNNIDGYSSNQSQDDNFPSGYGNITTSIVWGDGAVFSTWFSAAYAHILGIQGLPSNALNLHIGLYPDYLVDYVNVGLSESNNSKPSGLKSGEWRDLWWNIWAMTDATSSISDYETVSSYEAETGESKAHTFHWIHTFNELGQLALGTGELTADYPAASAFIKEGIKTYVVYNFEDTEQTVRFSDGTQVVAQPRRFSILKK